MLQQDVPLQWIPQQEGTSGLTTVRQTRRSSLAPGLLPTPTQEYRAYRQVNRSAAQAEQPPATAPFPSQPQLAEGCRALLWNCRSSGQGEWSMRKVCLPNKALTGPSDARITITGLPAVAPNALGDFIQTPGTHAFDCVHTFAVVRQTLTMYQRALSSSGAPAILPWQWNGPNNTEPLNVMPHGMADTMNAFYSRSAKALSFGQFIAPGSSPPQLCCTCRSVDIVAHTTGHAILDGLKPAWIMSNAPQSAALQEAFADLTAIFLALSQFDQVQEIVAQTRAHLHDKSFLAVLADESGLALGRPNGLRNADNDFRLSQVCTEVQALSQVFTGGIYEVLADLFAFERKPAKTDDAVVLYAVGQYLCGLLLRAIIAAPSNPANFADIVNQMLAICAADGKPVQYRNFIRNRFAIREVVVCSSLTADHKVGTPLEATKFHTDPRAVQNRSGCCGTMQHADFNGGAEALEEEIEQLRKSFNSKSKANRGVTPVADTDENGTHAHAPSRL